MKIMLSQQQERKWNTICYQQLIQDTFQRTYCNRYICNYWQSTILLIYAVIVKMQKSPCCLKQSKYKGKKKMFLFWYYFQGSLVCKEEKKYTPSSLLPAAVLPVSADAKINTNHLVVSQVFLLCPDRDKNLKSNQMVLQNIWDLLHFYACRWHSSL